jgi:outer membrane lipoprotein-sorting protein
MRKALAFLLLISLPVLALSGQQIIEKVENTLTAADDMTAVYTITVTDAGGTSQTSTLKIWTMGQDKRMIKYTAPSSVAGIGFLVLSDDEMYFYSPSRADVRRIAGHARYENFHNTDFSYQDLANYSYDEDYTAELLDTADGQYVLELTPRSGVDTDYTKLKMWVETDSFVFRRVDFYTSVGLIKRLTTGGIAVRDGYTSIGALLMTDVTTGHKTTIAISSIDYDGGLSSSFFSQRELQR